MQRSSASNLNRSEMASPVSKGNGVAGGVLMGGASRRMGRCKSTLLVRGEPLLHRQLRLLKEVGTDPLFVSQHPERLTTLPPDFSARIVVDSRPEAGPLAGLERLLAAASTPWVCVLAVDLPHLELQFLQELLSRITSTAGVIPVVEGRLEPLAAVYPRQAHALVEEHIARKRLAVQEVVRTGLSEGWMRPWVLHEAQARMLANWNCPEDVEISQGGSGKDRELGAG